MAIYFYSIPLCVRNLIPLYRHRRGKLRIYSSHDKPPAYTLLHTLLVIFFFSFNIAIPYRVMLATYEPYLPRAPTTPCYTMALCV